MSPETLTHKQACGFFKRLWGIFLVGNWCEKVQSIMGSATLEKEVLEYRTEQVEQASVLVNVLFLWRDTIIKATLIKENV